MKYDFTGAAQAQETSVRLTPGIKNATFLGIDFATVTSQKTGDTYNTLSLKLDVDGYGEYTQNFFEPQSDERTEGTYGTQPSPYDHFVITVRQLLDALDPDVEEHLPKLSGLSFKKIVEAMKKATEGSIGKKVQVKFIPNNTGYSAMPGFPATITRTGALGISTRFIGQNLVLTASEQKKINAANTAKPTSMNVTSVLDGMNDTLNNKDDDDLPF